MPTIEAPVKPESPAGGGTYGGGDFFKGFGGPGGNGGAGAWSVPAHTYQVGMLMAIAAIVMLFAAFTSAMVVRKGLSTDWVPTVLPSILFVNTAILIASSVTLEISRRSLTQGLGKRFALWLYATMVLGAAFVAGQLLAWRELGARGV